MFKLPLGGPPPSSSSKAGPSAGATSQLRAEETSVSLGRDSPGPDGEGGGAPRRGSPGIHGNPGGKPPLALQLPYLIGGGALAGGLLLARVLFGGRRRASKPHEDPARAPSKAEGVEGQAGKKRSGKGPSSSGRSASAGSGLGGLGEGPLCCPPLCQCQREAEEALETLREEMLREQKRLADILLLDAEERYQKATVEVVAGHEEMLQALRDRVEALEAAGLAAVAAAAAEGAAVAASRGSGSGALVPGEPQGEAPFLSQEQAGEVRQLLKAELVSPLQLLQSVASKAASAEALAQGAKQVQVSVTELSGKVERLEERCEAVEGRLETSQGVLSLLRAQRQEDAHSLRTQREGDLQQLQEVKALLEERSRACQEVAREGRDLASRLEERVTQVEAQKAQSSFVPMRVYEQDVGELRRGLGDMDGRLSKEMDSLRDALALEAEVGQEDTKAALAEVGKSAERRITELHRLLEDMKKQAASAVTSNQVEEHIGLLRETLESSIKVAKSERAEQERQLLASLEGVQARVKKWEQDLARKVEGKAVDALGERLGELGGRVAVLELAGAAQAHADKSHIPTADEVGSRSSKDIAGAAEGAQGGGIAESLQEVEGRVQALAASIEQMKQQGRSDRDALLDKQSSALAELSGLAETVTGLRGEVDKASASLVQLEQGGREVSIALEGVKEEVSALKGESEERWVGLQQEFDKLEVRAGTLEGRVREVGSQQSVAATEWAREVEAGKQVLVEQTERMMSVAASIREEGDKRQEHVNACLVDLEEHLGRVEDALTHLQGQVQEAEPHLAQVAALDRSRVALEARVAAVDVEIRAFAEQQLELKASLQSLREVVSAEKRRLEEAAGEEELRKFENEQRVSTLEASLEELGERLMAVDEELRRLEGEKSLNAQKMLGTLQGDVRRLVEKLEGVVREEQAQMRKEVDSSVAGLQRQMQTLEQKWSDNQKQVADSVEDCTKELRKTASTLAESREHAQQLDADVTKISASLSAIEMQLAEKKQRGKMLRWNTSRTMSQGSDVTIGPSQGFSVTSPEQGPIPPPSPDQSPLSRSQEFGKPRKWFSKGKGEPNTGGNTPTSTAPSDVSTDF